ncbi:MAG: hypothetical protein WDO15_04930 [Bacteroidota bacterium]
MTELKVEDKQKYLNKNYPFPNPPKLTEMRECIHCNNIFTVGDFKVFQDDEGQEYICCPHAPECDGTVIDWFTLDNKP